MPGIASEPSNQIGYINPGPLPMPQPQPIGNLFSGFNAGVEAVDSFQKKMSEEITRNDQQKTDLMANEIKRKLAPGQAENALAAQGLQADQIRAAKELQPGAHELALGEQANALETQKFANMLKDNDPSNDDAANTFFTDQAFIKTFGYAPPQKVTIENPNPTPKEPVDTWLEKNYGKQADQIANQSVKEIADKDADQFVTENLAKWDAARKLQRDAAQSAMGGAFLVKGALGTTEDNVERAKEDIRLRQEYANLEARRKQIRDEQMKEYVSTPSVLQEYTKYKTADKQQEFKKGTPEYVAKLQADIKRYIGTQALEAEKLKAVAPILTAQAKALADMPAAEAVAKSKSEKDLQEVKNNSKQLTAFETELQAYDKVDAFKNSGRAPTNADDIAMLYEFVKTLDPTSAVREGETKLALSTNPGVIKLYNQVRGLWSDKNKMLGDQARKDMFNTIDTLKKGAVQGIKPELQRIATVADDQGIPLKHILKEPLLKILWGTSDSSTPASTATMRAPSDPGYVPPPNGLPVQGAQQGYIWRWNGIDKFVKTGKAS